MTKTRILRGNLVVLLFQFFKTWWKNPQMSNFSPGLPGQWQASGSSVVFEVSLVVLKPCWKSVTVVCSDVTCSYSLWCASFVAGAWFCFFEENTHCCSVSNLENTENMPASHEKQTFFFK